MSEKKTLVFIHGWGMHAGYWQFIIPLLERDYNVVCIDLPGHGRRIDEIFPSNITEVTDQLARETKALGSATWIGWSLGGLIALAMSFYHSARVENLVMVGALPRFLPESSDARRGAGLTRRMLDDFKYLLDSEKPEKALQRLIALTISGEIAPSVVRKKLMLCLKERSQATARTLKNGLLMLRNTNLYNEASAIEQPTLLLSGEHDYFIEKECIQKTMCSLQNVKLDSILGAGHAPFLSQPDVFAEKLTQFMRASYG